ncbi:MAG: hypothetical protein IJA36_10245, partial [Lachnospiraceae bacterium]|nr:hypothetical protein [Lachnospiraceae bacterium]MBQ4530970.1 hypothetical protein [Lachnospiraceae bacterium]
FALYRLKTDINYATNRNCVLELGVKQWITSILISSCKKITEFHGFRLLFILKLDNVREKNYYEHI